MRKEVIGNATLYLGDCLSILPELHADACITDPPYGVKERTDRASKGRSIMAQAHDFPPIQGDDRPFDPSPWLAYPIVALWGAHNFASKLPDCRGWLVWDKRRRGWRNYRVQRVQGRTGCCQVALGAGRQDAVAWDIRLRRGNA